MELLLIAALSVPLAALLERNHRRTSRFPRAVTGAAPDRDLERISHDLLEAQPETGRVTRPSPSASVQVVCRPAALS